MRPLSSGALPVASTRSASVAPPSRCSRRMTAACFVGAALGPGTADAAPVSALAVAAAGARPSRRDALGRAPALVFALLFAICPSGPSRRTTRRHCHDPAIGLAPAGWEGSPVAERRPVNTHSNALERAGVQSDLPSRRRNQARPGDPIRTKLLAGSAVRFLLATPAQLPKRALLLGALAYRVQAAALGDLDRGVGALPR